MDRRRSIYVRTMCEEQFTMFLTNLLNFKNNYYLRIVKKSNLNFTKIQTFLLNLLSEKGWGIKILYGDSEGGALYRIFEDVKNSGLRKFFVVDDDILFEEKILEEFSKLSIPNSLIFCLRREIHQDDEYLLRIWKEGREVFISYVFDFNPTFFNIKLSEKELERLKEILDEDNSGFGYINLAKFLWNEKKVKCFFYPYHISIHLSPRERKWSSWDSKFWEENLVKPLKNYKAKILYESNINKLKNLLNIGKVKLLVGERE